MLSCGLWVVWIWFGLEKWILLGELLFLRRVSSASLTVGQAHASKEKVTYWKHIRLVKAVRQFEQGIREWQTKATLVAGRQR
jgi:hypothetical protein